VVTPAFKEHLIKNWKVPAEKISVVSNGVETELFSPDKINIELRRELGAEEKFIACYIGTMGMAHGLETVIEAAIQLKKTAPDILFLLVGDGAEKEKIAARALAQGLSNLRMVDSQPREKIPYYICTSDICLVLLKRTPIFETVIPTKMLEFMSCARPVVLGVEGQARQIVNDARAGVCIQPENAEQLAEALRSLAADNSLRKSLGSSGRQYVLKNFSRRQTAKMYLDLLQKIK
jgi:glycosyltransferase involved in cell wall biosynthesis